MTYSHHRAWLVTLLLGSAAAIIYFLIPDDDVRSVWYALIGASSGILILAASRTVTLGPMAWKCFGIALLLWAAGDFIWTLYQVAGPVPYPSISDALYLAGYPFAIAGVIIYVSSRRIGSMLRTVMDAALISIPVGLIGWELVVDRYVTSAALSPGDLIGLSYPILDLVLFGAAFALFLNPRPWADTRILGLSIAMLLLADLLYSAGLIAETYYTGIWYDALWIFSYVLWAAAALHPSAMRKTRDTSHSTHETNVYPMVAIAAAGSLIAVYLFAYFNDEDISLLPALLGLGATMLLAIARMAMEASRSRRSAEQVQDLFGHASDAIFIIDGRQYVDGNQAAFTMTGYSREELVTMKVGSLNPSDEQYLVDELFDRLEDGETVISEQALVRKDGSPVVIESHARQLPDGRFQSIVRDITARVEAERALRESDELLRHAFDTGAAGMALSTLDGTFIKVNHAFASMLGYEVDELAGVATAAITHPIDREITRNPLPQMARGELEEFHAEKRLLHQDGHEIWVRIDLALSRDADGDPKLLIAHILDISLSRELEAHLRRADKMDAIGRLAGGVAHDFNNLLAVVLNYASFVADKLGSSHESADDIQEIIKAGKRGADLTRQLLAFSRKDVPRTEVVSVNGAVVDLEPMLRNLIPASIQISLHLDPDVPNVFMDPSHLDQVLMNLALNARDAMPDQGKLEISTSDLTLLAGSAELSLAAGHYARISVTDTGTGIPDDIRENIFEPFFTTKDRDKGTGLGLATVFGVVNQVQGKVQIESTEGIGTRFDIFIPATLEEVGTGANDVLRGPIAKQIDPLDLLVVEDEPSVRAMTSRILRAAGHHVVEADNGVEALQLLEEATFDVLVTDVVMPRMSGLQLREQVDLPAVLISGYADDAIQNQDELPSGTTLILKPFTTVELLEAVSRMARPSDDLSTIPSL